ncbi:MAG TPA: BamA/TamA family outer membrane protein [Longimicrobiales bacterium]|nr:BamA/TamA family outer membrane protein [Longimicrobiales bacterium]
MRTLARVVPFMAAASAVALTAAPGHARQAPEFHGLLPDTTAERLVAFYNREPTLRLTGEARIGAGTTVSGELAVLGSLIVDGVVEGDVIVINGNLTVRSGARIGGSATVAGGEARIAPDAAVTGPVHVYREPLRYRHQGASIRYVPPTQEPGLAAGVDLPFGRTDLLFASHGPYNRVEGLPIAVGPRIRFAGRHPTTARAIVIARTAKASELEPRRIGYDLRAEQVVSPDVGFAAGARLYSEIAGVQEIGLDDREAALAAFVLHRDYRDYYERNGWSVYGALHPPGAPYTVRVEYRDENHVSRAAANPLTILDNGGPWRPQPSIAEGVLRSLSATVVYDTRNEDRDPSAGWRIDATAEAALGGTLFNRAMARGPLTDPASGAGPTNFITLGADVRRYARLTPYSRLAFRIVAAGSVRDGELPAQRQLALGGEGTMPGYRLMEFDCGARSSTVILDGETFHPYYGCDRMALVQFEYQANFPLARRLAESAGFASAVGSMVRWVAFFDAGSAWTQAGARGGRMGAEDDFSADAGIGLRVGPAGLYLAVPLSGRGQGTNFFIRLRPRI